MSYKVSLDSLHALKESVASQSQKWLTELENVQNKLQVLIDTEKMSGTAAVNVKSYMHEVHMRLLAMLSQLISMHTCNCMVYKDDYRNNVDNGLHFVIRAEELSDYKGRIESTSATAVTIDESIFYVLNGIRDIFQVSYSNVEEVKTYHTEVANFIGTLDEKIQTLEDTHVANDFVESGELLESIKSFINELMSFNRTYRTDFTTNALIASDCFGRMMEAHVKAAKVFQENAGAIETAIANEEQYIKDIEAEKEDREWAQWLALGVAVVGAVVLVVVTAGTASPLVCAGVGAAVGFTTAASKSFADNYVEHGSFTEGMNWSDFGKDCLIGTVSGAISGYAAGASSIGSAIKQPIDNAISTVASTVVEKSAEGLINTTWDVGEAIIQKKPGSEILSIVETDVNKMMRDITTDGVTDFVTGYIGGYFDVSSVKKGFLKSTAEGLVEGAAEAATENVITSAWDIGEAMMDSESSKNFTTILKEEGADFLGDFTKDLVDNSVGAVIDGANDGYDLRRSNNKTKSDAGEVINDILSSTTSEVAGDFLGNLADHSMEMATGQREDIGINEILTEDMDCEKIIKNVSTGAAKSITDKINEDDAISIKMKKKDYDNDGKVDVVTFDKYSVTKEDYDAACKVAGKGAYKGKTAQDILGISNKEKISEENVVHSSVSIDEIQKSSYKGRKTTNATKLKIKK